MIAAPGGRIKKSGCPLGQPVGNAGKNSAQHFVLQERAAHKFNPRMTIDIITDILVFIIAFMDTGCLFIGPSLPYIV
jgi:hypothetical protein